MPGMDGIELLKQAKVHPLLEVIVMTAYGTVEQAVEAMKEGRRGTSSQNRSKSRTNTGCAEGT